MKAQPYIDELRSIALRTDDENALIGSDNMQALIYNESSNIDSANKIFEKYVNDIDIVKDKTMAITLLMNYGINLLRQGSFEKSIHFLKKGEQLAIKHNELGLLGNIYLTLGMINVDNHNYKEAESQYKDAIDIYFKSNDLSKLPSAYSNLSNLYHVMDSLDLAIEYLNKSTELYRKSGNLHKLANSLHNKAAILYDLNRFDEVIELLKESIDLKEKSDDKIGASISYLGIAEVYKDIDELDLADKYLIKAAKVFEENNLTRYKLGALKLEKTINEKKGNYKKALEIAEAYHALNDSLYTENNQKALAEANAKYDLEKRYKENSILKNQSEIQRLISIIIAIGLLFVISLLLVYVKKHKDMTKINILLNDNKKQIETKNSELATLNDELRYLNNELLKKNNELIELNKTKDKFFSIISHDLIGPVSAQNSIMDMMLDDKEEVTEDESAELIGLIKQSSKITLNLLENLLVWGRVQMKQTMLNLVDFDLKELIDDTIENLSISAKLKSISIKNNCPNNVIMHADSSMISTIIRNTTNNSIKFSNDNSFIDINYHKTDDKHVLTIKDSGIGMNDEILNNLFRIDAPVSRPGTKNEKGTGLGLIICKEFVDMHGGEIQVNSKPGDGTEFKIIIPLQIPVAS